MSTRLLAQAGSSLLGAAATTAGSMLGAKLIGDMIDPKPKLSQVWDSFTERYPEYKGDYEAMEQFKMLADMSPVMIKHPIALKSYLDSARSFSGEEGTMVALPTVKTLTDIQKSYYDANKRRDEGIKDLSKSLSAIGPEMLTADIARDKANVEYQRAVYGRELDKLKYHEMTGVRDPDIAPTAQRLLDIKHQKLEADARLSAQKANMPWRTP